MLKTLNKRIIFRILSVIALVALLAGQLEPQSKVSAAPILTVTPITWNVIGLDSNDPINSGPENFPVGVRVCNTGPIGDTATDVTAQLVWDSSNAYVALRPGSLGYVNQTTTSAVSMGSVNDGNACKDIYFEVSVVRNSLAYDTTRRFHIVVDSNETDPVSTVTPRELYIEHLISQSRNSTTNVLLDGQAVAPGGTMALLVGGSYNITLIASTATNGYEQIKSFINFPNTIFRINSVSTTYTANDLVSPDPNAGNKLYADGCGWVNDLNSPNYRSCLDTGKYGGSVTVTYNVTILSGGGTTQTLTNLIYDFSGSSYHYNADFSVGARIAAIIDPTNVTITKSFIPNTTQVNGTSSLVFTLTNPNGAVLRNLNFTDTFPTSPGAMTTFGTTYTTNGCGMPTIRAPIGGGGYASGQPSVSVSNVTVAANGSCTISIQVTGPSAGTYNNSTSHLFIGSVDTGNSANSNLVMNNAPAPPACTPGLELASWNFASSLTPSYLSSKVSTATASFGGSITSTVPDTQNGQVGWSLTSINGSWPETASPPPGYPLGGAAPYFQFLVDSSNFTNVQISFDVDVEGNWASSSNNHIYVWSNANGGAFDTPTPRLDFTPVTKNTWYANRTATASTTGSSTTAFRINELGAKGTGTDPSVVLDNVFITGCGVAVPPTIAKSFSPNPIAVNGVSTLTFTLTNENNVPLTGVNFTDSLPSGVRVAGTPAASTTCGGTPNWSPAAGDTTLSFGTTTGATIPARVGTANGSCTVQVNVTATSAGSHNNVSGYISSTQSGTNTGPGGYASATLTAELPPQIVKRFAPNPILVGGKSTLTFTITNPNQNDALSGVSFTDTLPTSPGAMTVASPLTTSNTCGGSLVNNTGGVLAAGDPGIRLNGGTVTAGSSCTVSVQVTAPVSGTYANTSGNVSHVINAATVNGNTAADDLDVTPTHPNVSILKQVSTTGSNPWTSFLAVPVGGNVFYRFIVENTGDVNLTNVTVTDPTLAPFTCTWYHLEGSPEAPVNYADADPGTPGFQLAIPVADATDNEHVAYCGLGSVTAVSGTHTNTATVDSDETGPKTDSATYATTSLTIAKSVTQNYFLAENDVLNYSFVVTNSGFAPLQGPVTVSDDKANNEYCPDVNSAVQTSPPGPGDNDNFLDPGEAVTCTASYTVTAGDVTTGSVTNIASAIVSGVTSNTDSETVYKAGLTIDKDTSTPNAVIGGAASYSIVVSNTGGVPLTGVVISDSLPAGFTYASTGLIVMTGAGTSRTSTSDPTVGATILSWGTWTIAAGGSVTIPFTVDIGAGVSAGTYDNTASVVSTQIPGPTNDDGTIAQDPGTPPGQDPEDDEDVTVSAPTPTYTMTATNTPTPTDTPTNTPTPTSIPTATIGDRVWNDVNGNGVQDPGEPGIQNVRVYIDQNGNNSFDTGEPTDLTIASGNYSFTGLAAGIYAIRVDTTTLPAGAALTYDLDGTSTPHEASVTVTAGETRTDVDFGYSPTLFDPPFGIKFVDDNGLPVLRWTMVWINGSNLVAVNAAVSDGIPLGTTYAGGLGCTEEGVTTTTSCIYEAPTIAYPRGRIVWTGTLGPDFGATDAASANNELYIRFNVTVNTGINSVDNMATMDSDLNGDGDLSDPGEQIVATADARWAESVLLPETGFAPGRVTRLDLQPDGKLYIAQSDLWLEIPSKKVKMDIVGVPKVEGEWDVSWLGQDAGYLEGSAFPTHSGNSILTGHVYLPSGLPGPFINLSALKWGDRILVHAYGQTYIYEVRSVEYLKPNDVTKAFEHKDESWVTLLTCRGYDEKSDSYRQRVAVKAVLVKVVR